MRTLFKRTFQKKNPSTQEHYKEAHRAVSAIFSLGAPNRSGITIESMDKNLLALNFFSNELLEIAPPATPLQEMAIESVISKVFNLGNCKRQAFTLFLYILTKEHFNKSLELMIIEGESLNGSHQFVLADRKLDSEINNLSTWQGATYIDTWNGMLLSEEGLTSLSKEEFAAEGRMSGNIQINCRYRREKALSFLECLQIIVYLKEFKSLITEELVTHLRVTSPAIDYLRHLDDHQLVQSIYKQIDEDIISFQKLYLKINLTPMSLNPPSSRKPQFFVQKGIEREVDEQSSDTVSSSSLQELNEILTEYPANISARFKRAELYFDLKKYSEAESDYLFITEAYPLNFVAQNGLQLCRAKIDRLGNQSLKCSESYPVPMIPSSPLSSWSPDENEDLSPVEPHRLNH